MAEVATICVQTGLNPARHILESPWKYVRFHFLNFFGDVCVQGVYGSWFVFSKLSLSDIPIRNNQATSDRASAVAKVPSKWRVAKKGLNFGHAGVGSVGCRSILLEIPNWEFLIVHLIYKGVEDFHICSCCDGCIEEDGTNYAPPGHPTTNTNLLWMKGYFMYRSGIFTCPNTGILRINISREVKPRLVRKPSVVQNARILLKKCLKPSTVCHSFHLVRLF